jgi:branched-subunit amino acid ABC-type transport system permease component
MFDLLFFFEVLIGGLLSGVMYSLVALGFVLIFKASGVFNFAQGALVLFAALTFVFLLEYGEGGAIWAGPDGWQWLWPAWPPFTPWPAVRPQSRSDLERRTGAWSAF